MEKTKTIADIPLLGGHPALDFVNTVDAWRDRWGPDFLLCYEDLLAWGERAGLIAREHAERLRGEARADPAAAAEALDRAKALRRALHALFLAEAEGMVPAPSDAGELDAAVRDAAARRVLAYRSGTFAWQWRDDDDLDALTRRVAVAAADLLTARTGRRPVRECHGRNCGWLFLDTSRGGRRRWCSDETCGSHARVLRFRAKAPGAL
ncbi:CGNR zinc finger domain-containing protein [Labrys monachus]|uniref:RNA-binding Zn ribbon-like protein n=1 Tax=Labrys monachus TaxID=217067 RepID=A0ABU0FAL1_9HYPH|nr:CGNR zinc finger domain-containing protein [Labrys monachus]MDQ0391663.1 putative RNA-binding Zn ribbon-like protein [Labrys monachus]